MGHVLLTAAVRPAATVAVRLSDPTERLAQYREAFAWWAEASRKHGFGLIVAENSGAEPSLYADLFEDLPSDRFRLYTPEPGADHGRGKGALEATLIDGAVRASGLGADDAIYKVTGRLTVANAGEVFQGLPAQTLVTRGLLDNTRIDMRCVGATVSVWTEALAGMDAHVDERRGVDLGNVVAARALSGHVSGVLTRKRFDVRPQIRGVSGTFGRHYGHTVNRLSERFGRALERQLVRLAATKSV